MKKSGINCQLRSQIFLIVIFYFLLVNAAMSAPHICKFHKSCLIGIAHGIMVLTNVKTPLFLHFPIAKGETGTYIGIRHIYNCKLRNEKKKDLIQVRSEVSPPTSKLVPLLAIKNKEAL
jgi:hypothetical protein